jgi:hypothetical protein
MNDKSKRNELTRSKPSFLVGLNMRIIALARVGGKAT